MGKKTPSAGVARMNNAFSVDGGISFKTIGVIYIKGEETMCWFAAYDQVEKNGSVKKALLEKKGPYANSRSKRVRWKKFFAF